VSVTAAKGRWGAEGPAGPDQEGLRSARKIRLAIQGRSKTKDRTDISEAGGEASGRREVRNISAGSGHAPGSKDAHNAN